MKNIFLKAWKDPVWSKVIATTICGVAGVVGLFIYKKFSTNKNILEIATRFLELINYKFSVSIWAVVLFLLSFYILFKIFFQKKEISSSKQSDPENDDRPKYNDQTVQNIIRESFISNEIRLHLLGYQHEDHSLAYRKNLCINTYEPGTFTLAEINPDAKFIKNPLSFTEWLDGVFSEELEVLMSREPNIFTKCHNTGNLKEKLRTILDCKTNNNISLKHDIWYQEYSDIIRRIIFFILKYDPDYEIDLYPNLTYRRRELTLDVISYLLKHKNPTVADWLRLSIAAGLMGVDEKSVHSATSEINRRYVISLDNQNEEYSFSIERISNRLWDIAFTETTIDASEWLFNYFKLSIGMKFRLVAFSDDYIETIFLLQYYRELLKEFPDVEIDLIPRSMKCGNDATYEDVIGFLNSFPELKSSKRFRIHKNGPKLATVNLLKLHPSVMKLIEDSDLIDARGARNYEMMQGVKKNVCFGFMVCREFSESVIGLKSKNTPLVYIKQSSGEKSFLGFRDRNKRIEDGSMLCTVTANDNKRKLEGGHLSTYKNWSKEKKQHFIVNQAFYRKNALDFHKKYGDHLELEVKNYLNKFYGKILVVGCGSGKEVKYLHKQSCQPIGIDFSFEAIKIAKELHPGLWNKFSMEDLYNIEFYDNDAFDGVVFNASLVHLLERNDLSAVLINTRRILKKDGLCFIRLIEKTGISEEYDTILFENPRWFVYYTMDEIVTICSELHFNILETDRRPHVQYENVYWISALLRKN